MIRLQLIHHLRSTFRVDLYGDVVIEIGEKCVIDYQAYKIAVDVMDMSADMVIIDRSENLPDLAIDFE